MDTPETPNPAHAGMENGQGGGVPHLPSNPHSTVQQVVKAGGRKGGKPRADGLVPGSIEAHEADKAKDRERKKLARQRPTSEPPPLPPAPVGAGVDTPQTPDSPPPVVRWNPGELAPLFQDVVPAVEQWSQDRLASKAAKVPGFSPAMVDEVRKDAGWNKAAKAVMERTGPEVFAKLLSRLGVSPEHGPEVAFFGAVIAVSTSHAMLAAKLDKMARGGTSTEPPKPDAQPETPPPDTLV